VATGPKCYAYKLSNNEVKIKAKVISQNYANSSILNFDSMKQCIDEMLDDRSYQLAQGLIIENKLNFKRKKATAELFNTPNSKQLSMKYNKRVKYFNPTNLYVSYPYG